jgi:hypothetical protein
MSAQDAATEIITPMRAVYLPPRRMDEADERVALQQYVAALERYDGDILRAAWVKVRDNHNAKTWPWIGSILKACREVLAHRHQHTEQHDDASKACWEGGPTCERCKRKTRAPGFFVAPASAYRLAEDTRAEIDIWFRSLVGAPP